MHIKTFVFDMIKLLLLVIIDHIRSVPQKNTLNLIDEWLHYNINFNIHN